MYQPIAWPSWTLAPLLGALAAAAIVHAVAGQTPPLGLAVDAAAIVVAIGRGAT